MNLQKKITLKRLPKYLLLLMTELNSSVVNTTAAKIFYVCYATFIGHAMPLKKPLVVETLSFDV